ncbi:acetyl-CoA synthetase-like protein [Aspergillus vadensis CBS 113365]|uniref:Acetyl-CoA synthetase-like protein n=1 Tax=Aspergillus vadensis (strain CBS 113365 / IMI 142717 / IBT 24658) TaxID=1448311 RepID=A0A319AZN1_ASPVC|nr:acetyl-CoA synthetase-like protein [Aspergillus vadensis CBS 113365]PYH65777.1 acetyl-CoA synthetase-like protein [Aspergillus vadensis CBS 113365]
MEAKGEIGGIFPNLNDGVEAECTVMVQDILPLPVTDIARFCRDTEIAISLLLRTVWLIVMRPFLENDRICIGYRDYCDSPPHLASGPERVIQSDILPDAPVMELLKSNLGTELGNLCDECPPAHNTATALIREISGSGLLREAEKWNYNVALVGEVDEVSVLKRLSLVHKSSTLSTCLAENISSTVLQTIGEILTDSNRRIMDITLFSATNHDLVLQWNRKHSRGPATALIELVHQHAHLQDLEGIGPQRMVPVMITSPQWMTVAEIFTIMKAGGTFVPLDPTRPTNRLEDIIRQINATVAIASPDVAPILSSLVGVVVTVSPTTTSRLPSGRSDARWPDITPDTMAYVLFTSGSIGRPKGCVVCHGALGNAEYLSRALGITAESRVLQFASYGFAVSLLEVHCSLAVGATICIPSREDCLNGLNSAMDSMRHYLSPHPSVGRWTRVSMHLDIHGRINVNQLRTACLAMMQKHSIIRTVFTSLKDKSVQVVLKEPNVPFTYSSLSREFHDEVLPRTTPVPTKLPAEFGLVFRSQTDHSFTVRLLHAQYVGASLPLLFADLETGYSGQLLSPIIAVSFADYVYGRAQLRSADSLTFWKDYIRGASLTTLSNPTLAGLDNAAEVTAIVAGEIPTPPPGITLAMLVKASFAFTLAEMANTEDITFLLGLNTRGLPIKGVEGIVGPCIHRCPIQVQLRQTWTVSDLCQSVYDNYTTISRHCHLELPDIIDNCTDWPSGSDFPRGLNHVSTSGSFSFSLKDTHTLHSPIDAQVHTTNRLAVCPFIRRRPDLENTGTDFEQRDKQ